MEFTAQSTKCYTYDHYEDSQGSLSFEYNYYYNNNLAYPPSKDRDLGQTFIDKRRSSFSKNAQGGYDVKVSIAIYLNKGLQNGSAFLSRNPGLDYEVLAHELGHGSLIEKAFMGMNISDILSSSGLEGSQLNGVFLNILNQGRNEGLSYTEDYVNLHATSQFLPPGYQFQYIFSKQSIQW